MTATVLETTTSRLNSLKLEITSPLDYLTHFWAMFPFYTPRKHQKKFGFLVFSGGIEWGLWQETG